MSDSNDRLRRIEEDVRKELDKEITDEAYKQIVLNNEEKPLSSFERNLQERNRRKLQPQQVQPQQVQPKATPNKKVSLPMSKKLQPKIAEEVVEEVKELQKPYPKVEFKSYKYPILDSDIYDENISNIFTNRKSYYFEEHTYGLIKIKNQISGDNREVVGAILYVDTLDNVLFNILGSSELKSLPINKIQFEPLAVEQVQEQTSTKYLIDLVEKFDNGLGVRLDELATTKHRLSKNEINLFEAVTSMNTAKESIRDEYLDLLIYLTTQYPTRVNAVNIKATQLELEQEIELAMDYTRTVYFYTIDNKLYVVISFKDNGSDLYKQYQRSIQIASEEVYTQYPTLLHYKLEEVLNISSDDFKLVEYNTLMDREKLNYIKVEIDNRKGLINRFSLRTIMEFFYTIDFSKTYED